MAMAFAYAIVSPHPYGCTKPVHNIQRVIGCHRPNRISQKASRKHLNYASNSQTLHGGRRQILSSSVLTALVLQPVISPTWGAAAAEENNPKNELIEKLLQKSNANKAKYDKERLDDYYKRNYKEYFEFVEGTVRKENPSDAEKGILEWLRKNK
eukprot:Gb_15759 [translate_table: standard]